MKVDKCQVIIWRVCFGRRSFFWAIAQMLKVRKRHHHSTLSALLTGGELAFAKSIFALDGIGGRLQGRDSEVACQGPWQTHFTHKFVFLLLRQEFLFLSLSIPNTFWWPLLRPQGQGKRIVSQETLLFFLAERARWVLNNNKQLS